MILITEFKSTLKNQFLVLFLIFLGCMFFVSTRSVIHAVRKSFTTESKAILGADVIIRQNGVLSYAELVKIDSLNIPYVVTDTVLSQIMTTRGAKLVDVFAVGEGYPLAHKMTFTPQDVWSKIHAGDGLYAVVDEQLGIQDSVLLGNQTYKIIGYIKKDEARNPGLSNGRVFISRKYREKSNLFGYGSRVRQSYLFETADPNLLKENIKKLNLPSTAKINDESQNRSLRLINNTEVFLGLGAGAILFISLFGVGIGLRHYLTLRLQTAGIFRCLGLSPQKSLFYFLASGLGFGFIGVLVGWICGFMIAINFLFPLFQNYFPYLTNYSIDYGSLAILLSLSIMVWIVISFNEIKAIIQFPVHDLLKNRFMGSSKIWFLLLCSSLSLVFVTDVRTFWIIPLLLAFFASLNLLSVRLMPHKGSFVWKIALKELKAKPPVIFFSIITLAVFLVLTMQFTGRNLLAGLIADDVRPNLFLLDVPQEQQIRVDDYLRSKNIRWERAPLVRARLDSINGREIRSESRFRDREQNITFRDSLSSHEQLLKGVFWLPDDIQQVSLEAEFADDIGAQVGDLLEFDIQGFSVEMKVTSIRKVNWQSLKPNFFIVMHHEFMEDLPYVNFYAVQAGIDPSVVRDEIAAFFPDFVSINAHEIIEKLEELSKAISIIVYVLISCLIVSSLLLLVLMTFMQIHIRIRVFSLLRLLGLSQIQVHRALDYEFFLIGVCSSVLAVGLSFAATATLTHYFFDNYFGFPWLEGLFFVVGISFMTWLLGRIVTMPVTKKSISEGLSYD